MSSPPEFVSRTLFSHGCNDDDNEQSFMSEDNYYKILDRKGTQIRSLFTEFIPFDKFEIFPSPKLYGFRQRCRFGIVRSDDGDISYSIWEQGRNTKLDSRFAVASDSMNTVMANTKHAFNDSSSKLKYAPLIEGVSAINFHENRQGTEVMITLCNGLPLCPDFPQLAGELASELGVKAVIGRARKERAVSNHHDNEAYVVETMHIPQCPPNSAVNNDLDSMVRTLTYRQPEGSFSNPNGDIAELTAQWLCDKMLKENMKSQNRKFIEFYCGNANHGCYLSEYFIEVLGVEIDPVLCSAGRKNLEQNGITNGRIINKPAEDVAKNPKSYQFDSNDFMLVDPPRAGLDGLTLQLVRGFRTVVYIACDARSLARDLHEKGLGESHRVQYMAAFDHFPWHAEYLEVVCWLERKEE